MILCRCVQVFAQFTRCETSVTSLTSHKATIYIRVPDNCRSSVQHTTMHYQPDIPTITKTAPPSYAEAMAQTTTKDNSYAAPYGQPTSPTTTMYDQGCSQMPGYPPSAPANNFYSNIPNQQQAYSTPYVPMEGSQQYHRTTAPPIVHIERVGAQQNLCCDGCATCNKRVAFVLVFTILIIYLIKVIASQYV